LAKYGLQTFITTGTFQHIISYKVLFTNQTISSKEERVEKIRDSPFPEWQILGSFSLIPHFHTRLTACPVKYQHHHVSNNNNHHKNILNPPQPTMVYKTSVTLSEDSLH
jgi:hypothetical protein